MPTSPEPIEDAEVPGLEAVKPQPTLPGLKDVEHYERHPSDISYQDHPDYP